jgi:hypothetical protein
MILHFFGWMLRTTKYKKLNKTIRKYEILKCEGGVWINKVKNELRT